MSHSAKAPKPPKPPEPLRTEGQRVKGAGPCPAPILILGEGPGRSESIRGIPFVGRPGEQLNAALNRAYLDRHACYVCNVVQFRCVDKHGEDRTPVDSEIEAVRAVRLAEIAHVDPEVIITIGATATRFLFPQYQAVGGLETLQGKGFRMVVAGKERVVVPSFHPAAGLRDSRRMSDVFWAISEAGKVARGQAPVTDLVNPKLPNTHPVLAIDTETVDGKLWCATWAEGKQMELWMHQPDTIGPDALTRPALYHNALFDLQVLSFFKPQAAHDSMVAAYHIGTEPLGLKELTFRYWGLQMRKYEEVVHDADVRAIRHWLRGARRIKWPKPEGRKRPVLARLDNLAKKLDGEGPRETRTMWKDHDLKEMVEAAHTPFPRQASLANVPFRQASKYAKLDPVATSAVHQALAPRIESQGLTAAYRTDIAIIPMIARMQTVGMPVNLAQVRELEPVVREELDMIAVQSRILYGDIFNIASPDQVRDKLVETGFKTDKYTPRGKVSTSKEVLKAARVDNELADMVLEYRERAKNLTTFIPALIEFTREDGRIHPNFRTTNTETGRLSCHDPNLLAFPARSKLGLAVRNCFEAPAGWAFCNSDLDQIEMRLMAHEAQDRAMLDAISGGLDMHASTASKMFRVAYEDCVKGAKYEKKYRTPAKSIGFLVIYRGGPNKLRESMASEGLVESLDYWADAIRAWYEIYPGVRKFQQACDAEADLHGYVRDMWGRIRHVEGVWSTDSYIRSKCQREASNFPIQSGAQGLIKRAMIRVWAELQKPKWRGKVEPVLQVHDELVFLAREEVAQEWCKVVERLMVADASLFDVPLSSTSGVSRTWGGLK